MSSVAAACADGYYYPKDWRPEYGSINKFHNSHPLGIRAKDIANGILIVRFEMPFNVVCCHCETYIGRGVRYNAKKKKNGKYYTTPIWEFNMTCASCQGEMIIRTDPKNNDYELVSGVRRRSELENMDISTDINSVDNPVNIIKDSETSFKLTNDPFFKLEHSQMDRMKAREKNKDLNYLICRQHLNSKDNYSANSLLRGKFRKKKKMILANEKEAEKLGICGPLLAATKEDIKLTKSIKFLKGKNQIPLLLKNKNKTSILARQSLLKKVKTNLMAENRLKTNHN